MRLRLPIALFLLVLLPALRAANVINVTAPSGVGFSDTAQAVAFRTTIPYSNVAISMPLRDESTGGPSAGTEGTVYLMNAIGSGTTAFNQAAPPVTISGLSATFTWRTLWTGLTLPPGTYYVVVVAATPGPSASLSAKCGPGASMEVTPGAGVSDVGSRVTSALAGYPPASNFGGFNAPSQIFITVSGDPTSNLFSVSAPTGVGFSDMAQTVAFRTTEPYSNVSISMPLRDETPGGPVSGVEGTAYLMNSIGAGTTAANQVAPPVSLSGLSATFAPRTLWSGISLPAGTYYIVLVAASSGPSLSAACGSAGSVVVSSGPGVSDVGSRVTSALAAYPPASNFGGFNPPSQIFVTITGDRGVNVFQTSAPSGVGFSDTAQVVAFHTSVAYTNVTISLPLRDESPGGPIPGIEGTAYLVNAIGFGTTVANQVPGAGPVAVSGLTSPFAPVTLWTGVTLPPGTYYVVLVASSNGPSLSAKCGPAASMAVTLGSGVSDVGSRVTSVLAAYPPASNFGGFNPPTQIFVSVIGTAATGPLTPLVSFAGAPATAAYQTTFQVQSSTSASTTATYQATGACTISGSTVTMTSGSGTCSLTANWAADSTYAAADASQSTTAVRATPVVSWNPPPAIVFGSALGSGQLNATSTVAGTFTYAPPAGTVLPIGNGQTLSVTLAPSDSTNYQSGSGSTTINVTNPAASPSSPANLVVTYVLSRSGGNINVRLTVANNGGVTASNVVVNTVRVGPNVATPTAQSLGNIVAGTSTSQTFTATAPGASGSASTMSISVSYSGGSVNSTGRVTLP